MDKDQNQIPANYSLVWDCASSLYDSFELKSFKRQLDSAIASRCLSMPHLSDEHPPPPLPPAGKTKKHSKFSRSLHKLLRSVFRLRPTFRVRLQTYQHDEHGCHGVYWRSGSLASIPEVSEKDFGSPELDSAVSKTMSERLTSTTAGPLNVVS
ncbi:uncharacterized protein LOC103701352 [Phoenix dactylifera]|uniref:Uncharacterized protein LOC103701352 n=1 Tax=Phoenix dactylifera TaxID=42345 RepID=A0A8B7BMK1_PHODC|nr:uncharacterized protein LOC103701352 [Phoenix dactylifera]